MVGLMQRIAELTGQTAREDVLAAANSGTVASESVPPDVQPTTSH